MTFINRLDMLLKSKNLTRKKFLEIMGMGKNQITNWEKHNILPNTSTLNAIAAYFNVSVEYLKGAEDEENYVSKVVEQVVEWLTDNGYEYSENDNNVIVEKDGRYITLAISDFSNACMEIKKKSERGFELAMLDWERLNFPEKSFDLSDQERAILTIFRETTEEGRLEMIASFMSIKKNLEKKHPDNDTIAV